MVEWFHRGFRHLPVFFLLVSLVLPFEPVPALRQDILQPGNPAMDQLDEAETPTTTPDDGGVADDAITCDLPGNVDDDCDTSNHSSRLTRPALDEAPGDDTGACQGELCDEASPEIENPILDASAENPPQRTMSTLLSGSPGTWQVGDLVLSVVSPPVDVDNKPAGSSFDYVVEVYNQGYQRRTGLRLVGANNPENVIDAGNLNGGNSATVTMYGTITDADVAAGQLHIPDPGITILDEDGRIGTTGAFSFPFVPPVTLTEITLDSITVSPATCDAGLYQPPHIELPVSDEIRYWLEPESVEFAPGDEFIAFASWDSAKYTALPSEGWGPANEPGRASQEIRLSGCADAGLLVDIEPDSASYMFPSEAITYNVFARNIGEAAVSGITVTTGEPVAIASLAPGQRARVAAGTYQTTGPDITNGEIILSATVTGIVSDSLDPVEATGSTRILYVPPALIDLDVTPEWSEASCDGALVKRPSILVPVDETGTITFTADPPGEGGFWAPGQIVEIIATVSGGQVFGDVEDDWEIDPEDGQRATFTIPLKDVECLFPAISLEKSIDDEQPTYAAGDTVHYRLIATNTGTVDLSAVEVTDEMVDDLVCDGTAIEPKHAITCTATYPVTQPDIDAGTTMTNTASVIGTAPDGTTRPTASASVDAYVVEAAPAISLAQKASPASIVAAGEEVTYTFTVTNDGNVTLSDIAIDAPMIEAAQRAITCGKTTLIPQEHTDCTATFVVEQGLIDDGNAIENVATATGIAPNGRTVSSSQIASRVTIIQQPGIELAKAVSRVTSAGADREIAADEDAAGLRPGDVVTYAITITNTGNTSLTDITVQDDILGDLRCGDTSSLGPDSVITCTGTYTLIEEDAAKWRGITNTARVFASVPGGGSVDASDSVTIWPVVPDPALTLTLTADRGSYDTVGDVIRYSLKVENTGIVPIGDFQVSDSGPDGDLDCDVPEVLEPGKSISCTGSHTITQDDLDAGSSTNNTKATGTGPNGASVEVAESTTASANQRPALGFTRTLSHVNGDPVSGPISGIEFGDVLTYTLVASNSGNVTLTDVSITDSLADENGPDCAQPSSVAPGSSLSCTVMWTISQDDVDRGLGTSNARAVATAPDATILEKDASDTVTTIDAAPGISLAASTSPDTAHRAGDVITWSFAVTNTGNVTVGDLAVQGSMFDAGQITCPQTTIAPVNTVTCTATTTVSQAQIDYDTPIMNNATASGLAARAGGVAPRKATGDPRLVTSESQYSEVRIVQAPALTLVMTASTPPGETITAGTVVTWEFLATNSGNTTLREVLIVDDIVGDMASGGSGPLVIGTLAPGGSATARGTSIVSAKDMQEGFITNVAMVISGSIWSPEAMLTLALPEPGSPTPTPSPTPRPTEPASIPTPTPTPTSTPDGRDPTDPPEGAGDPVIPTPSASATPSPASTPDQPGEPSDAIANDPDITGLPSTGQQGGVIPGTAWIGTMLGALILAVVAVRIRIHHRG